MDDAITHLGDLTIYCFSVVLEHEGRMSSNEPLPCQVTLEQCQQQADALFGGLGSGDEAAAWRVKWEHPRFRGKLVSDVCAATLDLADAQMVVAREHGFGSWADLADERRRSGPGAAPGGRAGGLIAS